MTIWAKVLYYTNNGDNFIVTETKIYNDIAWNFLKITVLNSNNPAFIAKVNIDGVVVKMFPVLYMINPDLAQTFMMEFYDIDILPDSSYLVTSIGTYLHGEFGISPDSYKDLSVFKINSEENFEWVTSIDFNDTEQKTCSFLKDNIYYVSVSSGSHDCMTAIDVNSGKVLKSKCVYISPLDPYAFHAYCIYFVSNTHVFSLRTGGAQLGYIMILDANSLILMKIYYCTLCAIYQGFQTNETPSRTLFLHSDLATIIVYYFDDLLNYEIKKFDLGWYNSKQFFYVNMPRIYLAPFKRSGSNNTYDIFYMSISAEYNYQCSLRTYSKENMIFQANTELVMRSCLSTDLIGSSDLILGEVITCQQNNNVSDYCPVDL